MRLKPSHAQIWMAIDALAERSGYSTSGLAKRSGLDPTAFNKSKRIAANGKLRWPSTESVSRILTATNTTLADFSNLTGENAAGPAGPTIPFASMADAQERGLFDIYGQPTGRAWDEMAFPEIGSESDASGLFALEVAGDKWLPFYRDGDVIVIAPQIGVRKGDRVIAKTTAEELILGTLARRAANRIVIGPLNPDRRDRAFDRVQIAWIARIIWASQ